MRRESKRKEEWIGGGRMKGKGKERISEIGLSVAL